MTAHLLLLTLGPVQGFIAQARRTRDLWMGSHLLSELSRTVARTIAQSGGELVFPALVVGNAELEPCLGPLREQTKRPPLSIANKVLAIVPAGVNLQDLVNAAGHAAQTQLREDFALKAWDSTSGLTDLHNKAAFAAQLGSFLEFHAAAALMEDVTQDYGTAWSLIEQAVASRKTRHIFAAVGTGQNKRKCSLCGAQESVLRERDRAKGPVRKYRISGGEHLCALGLTKRAGGKPEQYLPIANIALASWIQEANRRCPKELKAAAAAARRGGVARVNRKDLPAAEPFIYDAQILLPQRQAALFEEQGITDLKTQATLQSAMKALRQCMKTEPTSYVVCLVADGDRMGTSLKRPEQLNPERHRAISASLSKFSQRAREIIEQMHLGSLVYAGGDDVLAFLPIDQALAAATALRLCFESTMAVSFPNLAEVERPTLSIGLGIGHMLSSMRALLELGRQAEVVAKAPELEGTGEDRNALAVLVDKRSGSLLSWRLRWTHDPVARLKDDVDLLDGSLPSSKVQEVRRMLQRMGDSTCASMIPVWEGEVTRILSRAQAGEESALTPADVGLCLPPRSHGCTYQAIDDWSQRMRVAMMLRTAKLQESS